MIKGYHDVDSLFPEDPTPEQLRDAVYDAAMALQAEIARSVVHPVEGGLSDLMTDYALLKNPRLAEAVGAFDCACRRAKESGE